MLTSLRGSVSVKKIANKIQTLVKALGNDTVSETEL
jgi:hypothetical protein